MKEHVDLLMGTISSASALAISQFAKTEKIPFLCTYSKSDKIVGELRASGTSSTWQRTRQWRAERQPQYLRRSPTSSTG